MPDVDRRVALAAALAELGDDSDAIADALRAKGITGVRDEGDRCPLANYLRGRGFDGLTVTRSEIVDSGGEFPWRRVMYMPGPASTFVKWFDHGVYLDLVEVADA